MVPNSILLKMRASLSATTLAAVLGTAGMAAEAPETEPFCGIKKYPELTVEQKVALTQLLNEARSEDAVKAKAAVQEIGKMGKSVLPFVTGYMKKLMDPDDRNRVQRVLDFLNTEDTCPRCGKG